VGWYLDLSKVLRLKAPELREVGEYLGLQYCKTLWLPKLESVAGGLKAPNAQEVHIPKLKKLQKELDINPKLFQNFNASQVHRLLESIVPSSQTLTTLTELRKRAEKIAFQSSLRACELKL